MENITPPKETPPCNIDRRPPNTTYISAWRDRAEFLSVYEKIFNSTPGDIESKANGLEWMKMWKVRQVMYFPVCIRCTCLVLEAQLIDLRCKRDGHELQRATEIKNIYAGAFTRFINFLTEGVPGGRKRNMAEHVREIGIESYLVELRHLCAHRTVSISVDVFRRSAQYCMDWLKVAYWQRELSTMQPVHPWTVRRMEPQKQTVPDPATILRTYDAAAAGQVRKMTNIQMVASAETLTPDERQLLEVYASQNGSPRLKTIVRQTVRDLHKLNMPPVSATSSTIVQALFDHCPRLFADAVQYGSDREIALGEIHSGLFRYLATIGCLQAFFERLIVICEMDIGRGIDMRPSARYWAQRIADGFLLLRQFKKGCTSLPAEDQFRFGQKCTDIVARKWYARQLSSDAGQHLILGLHIDCPWHLKLSRPYVLARLTAMNEHTKDIVPILLSLLEPPLKPTEQRKINELTAVYNSVDHFANGTVSSQSKIGAVHNGDTYKIYTADDLVEKLGMKRSASGEEPSSVGQKLKRYGPWREPDDTLDWSNYPLGTCHG